MNNKQEIIKMLHDMNSHIVIIPCEDSITGDICIDSLNDSQMAHLIQELINITDRLMEMVGEQNPELLESIIIHNMERMSDETSEND